MQRPDPGHRSYGLFSSWNPYIKKYIHGFLTFFALVFSSRAGLRRMLSESELGEHPLPPNPVGRGEKIEHLEHLCGLLSSPTLQY